MKVFYFVLITALFSALLIGCKDSTTAPTLEPTPYEKATVKIGGIMYDKFWSTETGFNQNDTNIAKFSAKSDFFRCKQCHAWDYLGRNGSYIGRGPTMNRPRVANINLYQFVQSNSAQQIFDAIKTGSGSRRDISYDLSQYEPNSNFTEGDKMPNFSQLLTDAQIWDLVKYLKEGAFDVSALYDATYSGVYPTGTATYSNIGRDGNPTNGTTYYGSKCSSCHGTNGTAFLVENMTVGKFTRTKPNEVQHKVKYGTLGTAMLGNFDISLSQMKDLYKALSDTTAFPNQQ